MSQVRIVAALDDIEDIGGIYIKSGHIWVSEDDLLFTDGVLGSGTWVAPVDLNI